MEYWILLAPVNHLKCLHRRHNMCTHLALTSRWSCFSCRASSPQRSGSHWTAMSVSFSRMSRPSSLLRHKHSSMRTARLACWQSTKSSWVLVGCHYAIILPCVLFAFQWEPQWKLGFKMVSWSCLWACVYVLFWHVYCFFFLPRINWINAKTLIWRGVVAHLGPIKVHSHNQTETRCGSIGLCNCL